MNKYGDFIVLSSRKDFFFKREGIKKEPHPLALKHQTKHSYPHVLPCFLCSLLRW